MSYNPPPPNNPLYPQLYNPANAPPPQAYPGGHPGVNPYPYQPGPGYAYPYPGQAGQVPTGHYPAAMSYPGISPSPVNPVNVTPGVVPLGPTPVLPTAPPYGFGVTPVAPGPPQLVEWVPTTTRSAVALSDRAVVAGYEGHDGSPLWVIRAKHEGDTVPGKFAVKHNSAYIPWGGNEVSVQNIEVCCVRPEKIRWVPSSNGTVPPNAIPGGQVDRKETLYIGRAKHEGSLTPGKIHQSHGVLYISFAGKEHPHKNYEVLCTV